MSETAPPHTVSTVVASDIFLLNGLVELFYGALSLLPTFMPQASGFGTIEPISGDAIVSIPQQMGQGQMPQPIQHQNPLFPPMHQTQNQMMQQQPQTVFRIPTRPSDLLALGSFCFGGVPSIIFWMRGVGGGAAEDQSARDYAVGALIYHISVPLLTLFKFVRAAGGPSQMPTTAAGVATAAAVQASGRSWNEGAIASGVMHLGLAVGFARWLARSYSKRATTVQPRTVVVEDPASLAAVAPGPADAAEQGL